ncbi:hypothetical protein DENSPDRAFT_804260 [Dentipellis sp. KUC8613]|nr:hypothetical protein DENSPDRAFT_804260 [Dentipellis sp. KUC8613]
MVSADNLNYDVLELIFLFLNGPDLASVSLVSRSFLAGVTPRLYQSLVFYQSQAKRFARVQSPFAAAIAHPGLAIHVRNIDIRAVPNTRIHSKAQPSPQFLRDATAAVTTASNLNSFTCTLANIVPVFLVPLQTHERLHTLRLNAYMTADQTAQLTKIKGLKNVMLENASWQVIDALPKWAQTLAPTLQSLTIYMSRDMNPIILQTTLPHIPKLRGLYVMGCPNIDHHDVLRATAHTPELESLGFSTANGAKPFSPHLPALRQLKHLSVDSDANGPLAGSTLPTLWASLFAYLRTWDTPLHSLSLQLSARLLLGDAFVQELVDDHGVSLRQLSLYNCSLSTGSIEAIAEGCPQLEKLVVPVPVRDYLAFNLALAASTSLQTLVDGDVDIEMPHMVHGKMGMWLTTEPVRHLMEHIPTLRLVVSENRHWTSKRTADGVSVSLERKKQGPAAVPWYMAPA